MTPEIAELTTQVNGDLDYKWRITSKEIESIANPGGFVQSNVFNDSWFLRLFPLGSEAGNGIKVAALLLYNARESIVTANTQAEIVFREDLNFPCFNIYNHTFGRSSDEDRAGIGTLGITSLYAEILLGLSEVNEGLTVLCKVYNVRKAGTISVRSEKFLKRPNWN